MSPQERTPEEIFVELNSRLINLGLPFDDLVGAAKYERELGGEGAFVQIEPDETGAGAVVVVKAETVDFKLGGFGPYVLDLAAAQKLIEPPDVAAS